MEMGVFAGEKAIPIFMGIGKFENHAIFYIVPLN